MFFLENKPHTHCKYNAHLQVTIRHANHFTPHLTWRVRLLGVETSASAPPLLPLPLGREGGREGRGNTSGNDSINSTIIHRVSCSMTTIANGSANATVDELSYHDSQGYELAYIALTLFISALSALLASFFGLHRPHLRRRRRHDTASPSSLRGIGSRTHGIREDKLHV